MKKLEFLIVREGESTQAVVSLETSLDISSNNAMHRICECVAEWINNTDEGKAAWDESGEDFNIGDLSGYTDNQYLIDKFNAAGLWNVKIAANEIEVLNDFTYDSILPRRSDLFTEPE